MTMESEPPTEEAPLYADAHDTLGRGGEEAIADRPSDIEDDPTLAPVLGRLSRSFVAHRLVAGHGEKLATRPPQNAGSRRLSGARIPAC